MNKWISLFSVFLGAIVGVFSTYIYIYIFPTEILLHHSLFVAGFSSTATLSIFRTLKKKSKQP